MTQDPIPSGGGHAAQQASAREFLTVVFRRRWIIIGLFLIVSVTVGILALMRPARYASFGSVLVKRGEQESSLGPGRRIGDWEEELATEAQVVLSWTVRQRAQQTLDEEANRGAPAVYVHSSDINVQVIGRSNVMEIAYVDLDPDAAHRVCRAVIDAYVEYRSTSGTLPYPRSFFEGELQHVRAAMDSLAWARRGFTESQDVVDLEEQRRASITLHRGLMHERAQTLADLAEENGKLRMAQALRDNPDIDLPVTGAGFLNEGALGDLKVSMIRQETKIAQLQEVFRDDAPELADARATLESMRAVLRREVEQRMKLAQAKVQGLRSRLEMLDHQIAGLESELAELPAKEARLTDIDQRLTVLKARYLDLTRGSDQAKVIEQTSRRVSVVVLTPASPARPQNTRDYVRLALAPAFSLVVGLGLAFFIDGLDTRLRTPRDLEQTLDVPVLASLNERRR